MCPLLKPSFALVSHFIVQSIHSIIDYSLKFIIKQPYKLFSTTIFVLKPSNNY